MKSTETPLRTSERVRIERYTAYYRDFILDEAMKPVNFVLRVFRETGLYLGGTLIYRTIFI